MAEPKPLELQLDPSEGVSRSDLAALTAAVRDQARDSIAVSDVSATIGVPLERQLLLTARALLANQYPEAAVLTAHTAAEVLMEDALRALVQRQVTGLDWDDLQALLPNSHFTSNDKLRKLYQALSEDDLTSLGVWREFKDSVTTRNHIAHRGLQVDAGEAEKAIRVVDAVMSHVRTVVGRRVGWPVRYWS